MCSMLKSYFVIVVVLSVMHLTMSQPIGCSPCSCYCHKLGILTLTCDSVSINDLNWNNLMQLETIAHLQSTNFGFHQFPATSRNLTTSISVTNSQIQDLDLSGFFVLQKLVITKSNISNLNDLITVENSLQELVIQNTNLKKFNLKKNSGITLLNLAGNQLDEIPTSNQLTKLILAENSISILETTECNPMKNLNFLDLSSNLLTDLPENAFKCLIPEKAENFELLLSKNKIKTIHPNAFFNTEILNLDLSHNQLTIIDSNTLNWRKMNSLNLQFNPWDCQCKNQWMLDDFLPYMYQHSPNLLYHLRCASPKDKMGRPFVFWYNHTGQIFCEPSTSNFDLFQDATWTPTEISVAVLGTIIICLLISLLIAIIYRLKNRYKTTKKPKYSPIGEKSPM